MYIIQVIFYWTMSPATELRLFHSLMHTDYESNLPRGVYDFNTGPEIMTHNL